MLYASEPGESYVSAVDLFRWRRGVCRLDGHGLSVRISTSCRGNGKDFGENWRPDRVTAGDDGNSPLLLTTWTGTG